RAPARERLPSAADASQSWSPRNPSSANMLTRRQPLGEQPPPRPFPPLSPLRDAKSRRQARKLARGPSNSSASSPRAGPPPQLGGGPVGGCPQPPTRVQPPALVGDDGAVALVVAPPVARAAVDHLEVGGLEAAQGAGVHDVGDVDGRAHEQI